MEILSKRTTLKLLVGSLLIPVWTRARSQAPETVPPKAISQWMTDWMTDNRLPIGGLHLFRFADPIYVLTKPITWKPNPGQDLAAVNVPKGFVTDFASIPRIFWSILRPDGQYTYPAIVHDYMYWMQDRPRAEADLIFKYGMDDFAIDRITVASIYDAVRVGGGSAWDNNAKLKSGGERRVLRLIPNDPLTTWEEWKNTLGVFA